MALSRPRVDSPPFHPTPPPLWRLRVKRACNTSTISPVHSHRQGKRITEYRIQLDDNVIDWASKGNPSRKPIESTFISLDPHTEKLPVGVSGEIELLSTFPLSSFCTQPRTSFWNSNTLVPALNYSRLREFRRVLSDVNVHNLTLSFANLANREFSQLDVVFCDGIPFIFHSVSLIEKSFFV